MRRNKALILATAALLISLMSVGCDTPAHAQPYRTREQQCEDVVNDLLYNRRTQGMCLFSTVEAFNDFTAKYNNIIHVSSVNIANDRGNRQMICATVELVK